MLESLTPSSPSPTSHPSPKKQQPQTNNHRQTTYYSNTEGETQEPSSGQTPFLIDRHCLQHLLIFPLPSRSPFPLCRYLRSQKTIDPDEALACCFAIADAMAFLQVCSSHQPASLASSTPPSLAVHSFSGSGGIFGEWFMGGWVGAPVAPPCGPPRPGSPQRARRQGLAGRALERLWHEPPADGPRLLQEGLRRQDPCQMDVPRGNSVC